MQHIKISESVPENKTFVMSKWCHQPRNVGNQWTWNMQHMMCDGWSSSWGRMKDKKKTGRLHRCVKYLRGPLRSHKDCTRTSWPHTGRREEKIMSFWCSWKSQRRCEITSCCHETVGRLRPWDGGGWMSRQTGAVTGGRTFLEKAQRHRDVRNAPIGHPCQSQYITWW